MTLLAHLADLVDDASRSLPGVERKRMFGCDAWFAGGSIYALVWKHGRIALKLPEPAAYAELLALPGAAPWTAGDRTMSGWGMVPEAFHDRPETLEGWTERAHRLALAAPARKPAAKQAPAKKPAPRAPAAKKAPAKTPSPAKTAARPPDPRKRSARSR